MEPSEFFDEIAAYIGRVVRSFNKDEFPDKTLSLIKETCDFLDREKKCLSMRPVELQLRDALIGLVERLKKYGCEALTDSVNNLAEAVKRKDFVKAKMLFKEYTRTFLGALEPEETGLPAPSTVWRNTFRILQKILG